MAPPTKCPACGGDLPPFAEACPNCPWSYQGEEHGISNYKSRRGRDFSGPVGFFVAIVGVGCVAWFGLNHVIEFASRDGSANDARLTRALAAGEPIDGSKKVVDARHIKMPKEEPVIEITHEEAPEKPARARKAGRRAEWRLRGAVYDMVSLKPVIGATIVLKDVENNRRIETTTDGEGRYRFSVPPLPGRGYAITFDDPNYAANAMPDPGNDPLRRKPKVERERLAAELGRSLMAPQALQPEDAETPLVTNFYLAPRDLR